MPTINPKAGAVAPPPVAQSPTVPADTFDPIAMEMILNPPDGEFDLTAALVTWEKLNDKRAFFTDWEMTFRKKCFEVAFPDPKPGVNNFPLNGGWLLKGTPKTNVKIDKEMIPAIRARLAAQNVSVDSFLKVAYSLDSANYKAAKDAGESWLPILNEMITSTPGSPVLEITLPAKAKK